MLDMIKLRRSGEYHEELSDLFSMLLNAAEDDLDGEPQLTDRELTGTVLDTWSVNVHAHSTF